MLSLSLVLCHLSREASFLYQLKAMLPFRDGILGHQFNKRLESFASFYSQSLLLADFKENQTLS
jgi:hypothetical protein